MSDKTELNLEAERASFAAWNRAEFGYAPLETDLYGHAFDIWCAARRATIQPTACQPVHQWRSRLVGSAWFDDTKESAYRANENYEARTLYTSPVALADAVRDAERLAFLHSVNKDADGYEYGVAKVKQDASGRIEVFLWALSDHSDIDAAIRAMKSTPKEPA